MGAGRSGIRERIDAQGRKRYQVQIRRKGVRAYSRTFSKLALAKAWKKQEESKIEAQDIDSLSSSDDWVIHDIVAKFEDEVISRYAESGRATYKYRLKLIDENFGHFRPSRITPMVIVEYVTDRADDGLSSDSIRKELQILSGLFDSAMIWGYSTPVNPVPQARKLINKLRILSPGEERDRRISEDELQRLMMVNHRNKTNADYIPLFVIETGLRRSELARCHKDHIDIENRIMIVPKSKTDWKTGKKGRIVPLSEMAIQIIECLLPDSEEGLLFGQKPRQITQAFDRLCHAANIKDLRLHDLRHEAISRWFEQGFQIHEVGAMSGHKDWRSLKRYTHPNAAELARRMI